MMIEMNPSILMQLGEWRLEELRGAAQKTALVAAVRTARRHSVAPRWRLAVGGALVSAGMRVRGVEPC